jgi:ribosomal protein S18 acetylase RimI-like enzyme
MVPQIIKVSKGDNKLIRSVIENFIETSDNLVSIQHIEKFLSDDRTHLFTALEGQNVLGFALVYSFPSMSSSGYLAYLYDIEVMENRRRKGIGRLLMKTLLTHLNSIGVTELWLGTATDNFEGQALFSSTGGIKSGETFNDFTYIFTSNQEDKG